MWFVTLEHASEICSTEHQITVLNDKLIINDYCCISFIN